MACNLTKLLGIGLGLSLAVNGCLGYQYARLDREYKNIANNYARAVNAAERAVKSGEHASQQARELLDDIKIFKKQSQSALRVAEDTIKQFENYKRDNPPKK